MKALIRITSLLLLAIVAGCGGSSKSPINSPSIAFLYVAGQGVNSIQAFGEKSDGELAALSIASFPTSASPVAMVLHTSKNFLYVANSTSNTVSGYTLNHTTGDLAPIGTALPPTPVGVNPVGVGVNSGGQFLFVLNQGSVAPPAPATISVFSIDPARGLLTEITGSPFATAANPQFLVVSPTAGFLYVANGAAGTISAFSIAASGALSPVAGSPFSPGGTIAGMAIDPKGQFLFAADSANNNILSFSIAGSGALTPVGTFAAGTQPVAVAVDSSSTFLYSANHGSNDVSAFKISAGALTPVTGSPYATGATGIITPSQPSFVTVDTTNGFLYVANQGSKGMAAFSIKAADGSLTVVTNSPFGQSEAPLWVLSTK